MSASMTAPEQIDGLEKLLALANLRPETIIATQTAAREQLQLTQAEQGKVAEAKAYITKHAELTADLQRREDELAAARAEHNKAVGDFSAHVDSENTRLNDLFTKLGAQKIQQDETDKRHAEEIKNLAASKSDNDRQNRETLVSLQRAEAANTVTAQANATEASRLKSWEDTLKAKAQRIRTEASSF